MTKPTSHLTFIKISHQNNFIECQPIDKKPDSAYQALSVLYQGVSQGYLIINHTDLKIIEVAEFIFTRYSIAYQHPLNFLQHWYDFTKKQFHYETEFDKITALMSQIRNTILYYEKNDVTITKILQTYFPYSQGVGTLYLQLGYFVSQGQREISGLDRLLNTCAEEIRFSMMNRIFKIQQILHQQKAAHPSSLIDFLNMASKADWDEILTVIEMMLTTFDFKPGEFEKLIKVNESIYVKKHTTATVLLFKLINEGFIKSTRKLSAPFDHFSFVLIHLHRIDTAQSMQEVYEFLKSLKSFWMLDKNLKPNSWAFHNLTITLLQIWTTASCTCTPIEREKGIETTLRLLKEFEVNTNSLLSNPYIFSPGLIHIITTKQTLSGKKYYEIQTLEELEKALQADLLSKEKVKSLHEKDLREILCLLILIRATLGDRSQQTLIPLLNETLENGLSPIINDLIFLRNGSCLVDNNSSLIGRPVNFHYLRNALLAAQKMLPKLQAMDKVQSNTFFEDVFALFYPLDTLNSLDLFLFMSVGKSLTAIEDTVKRNKIIYTLFLLYKNTTIKTFNQEYREILEIVPLEEEIHHQYRNETRRIRNEILDIDRKLLCLYTQLVPLLASLKDEEAFKCISTAYKIGTHLTEGHPILCAFQFSKILIEIPLHLRTCTFRMLTQPTFNTMRTYKAWKSLFQSAIPNLYQAYCKSYVFALTKEPIELPKELYAIIRENLLELVSLTETLQN